VRGLVSPVGSAFQIAFVPPGGATRTIVAVTDRSASAPRAIARHQPSSWYDASHAADYVIVSHAAFLGALQPLRQLREARGHTVAVVNVEDLYDEFSFGQKTPFAIRDFVRRARTAWRLPPRFLLLVGNATTDPRNYLGTNEPDYLPTKIIDTAVLETASDDWFADLDGDGVPELAVGRLPARSASQAAAIVAKIRAYETEAAGEWSHAVTLVADARARGDADFAGASAALQPYIPAGYTVHQIDRGETGTGPAQATLVGLVQQGQAIVHYSGHGSVQIWHDDLLTTDVAAAFSNGARLPLFVMMNCLNGFFHGLFPEESLAEALVRAPAGGAIGAWASSGLTDPRIQQVLDEALFRVLFTGGYRTVGEVLVAAKQAVSSPDVRRTWIFFGDPAMQLKGLSPARPPIDARGPLVRPVQPRTPGAFGTDRPGKADVARGTAPADASIALRATRLSDWDGDGIADVFLYASTRWQIVSSTQGAIISGEWDRSWEPYPADLNGDGLTDLLLFDRATGTWAMSMNQGRAFITVAGGAWNPASTITIADVNGDGADDILLSDPATGQISVGVNDRAGGFVYRADTWPAASSITPGDFNGDGTLDVFLYEPRTGAWALGIGDGTGQFSFTTGTWASGWTVRAANLDGDRRTDLLLYNPASGAAAECVALATNAFACKTSLWTPGLTIITLPRPDGDDELLYESATGQFTLRAHRDGGVRESSGTWPASQIVATGDLDGDAQTDVLLYDDATGRWSALLRSGRTSSGTWLPGLSLILH
jgi:hypothetical protein